MEEILASIRRIISEDEAPAEPAEPAAAVAEAPEPEPPPPPVLAPVAEPVAEAPVMEEPAVVTSEEDEVLELTDRVETPALAPAETHGDIDVYAARDPEPRSAARPAAREPDEDQLISRGAAESAASAFGHLAQSLSMPKDGRTLEDVVRELLRPLLKTWLDEHLPEIVQARVEAEVERIARGRTR